ncbi:4-(cytidine 5'-diphospho)-2-C-methyl-D-erythritol kinase [Microbacterium sp. cf332]|uniref:4-(cytidine 5'-diphospho)-2-C-methyl-D-erythritol kinase n=1 Tax=Microbacterium sp. cf332 TaxID=1761804 RepID=UPI000889F631|nr:4-(cytidine 5'-diphospho)-2-C-methyl-D-erythritol kinase [Microbacterium sp. cf332]SDQ05134.1 4-diphosphocytidyl-2-C-methyl-D-erythritol kinase [Microbacterium sp. cf332]
MNLSAVPDRVRVRAPGKINLFLEVGSVQDDGYHDVASVYQAVSLYEDLIATPADDFTVRVVDESGQVVPGVPSDDRNLALRAARMVAREVGYLGGVHLDIRKSVPVAGGMGGGSADAAAALVACDALWGAGLTSPALQEMAARLGADVPFSLLGGSAVGTGRGDRLSPALGRARFDWVVVADDGGLATPAVYAELDRLREARRPDIAPEPGPPEVDPVVLQALRSGSPDLLAGSLRNDLHDAACSLRPDLCDLLDRTSELGALAGLVSGSGPTLAFLAADADSARGIEHALSAAGHRARHVSGPVAGAKVVSR